MEEDRLSSKSSFFNETGKKILWISFLIFDKDVYKNSQIEVLKSLGELGHKTWLFGISSETKFSLKVGNFNLVSFPMRYKTLFTSIMYTLLLSIYLPFFVLFSKTDIVIVEPQNPSFLSLIPLRLFPKTRRPKLVLDIRSTPVDLNKSNLWAFNIGVRFGKKICDGMTTITPMMRAEVCERFKIDTFYHGRLV